MKLIDRYIIRQFLSTATFALLAVLVVFLVIDVMEKLDDFIDRQASWDIILLYYFYFVPEIIKLIIPVAMLLASLFVTARLSTQGEWTALKSSGVSLYRLMLPFLAVAMVISVLSVYFNGWVVPFANKKKFTIERVYLHKDVVNASGANIYIQDTPTKILSLGYFDDTRNVASASASRISTWLTHRAADARRCGHHGLGLLTASVAPAEWHAPVVRAGSGEDGDLHHTTGRSPAF